MVPHWPIVNGLYVPDDDNPTCAHSRCEDAPDPDSTTGLCTWHMAVEDGEDDA